MVWIRVATLCVEESISFVEPQTAFNSFGFDMLDLIIAKNVEW